MNVKKVFLIIAGLISAETASGMSCPSGTVETGNASGTGAYVYTDGSCPSGYYLDDGIIYTIDEACPSGYINVSSADEIPMISTGKDAKGSFRETMCVVK